MTAIALGLRLAAALPGLRRAGGILRFTTYTVAAFGAGIALALAAVTVGVTVGAFAGATSATGNVITAMPDFRGPTITDTAIGKSAGFATGFIRTGATYYVYATGTDVGTPPSGIASVTANVNLVTLGQTSVPMTAGSYPVAARPTTTAVRSSPRRRCRTGRARSPSRRPTRPGTLPPSAGTSRSTAPRRRPRTSRRAAAWPGAQRSVTC